MDYWTAVAYAVMGIFGNLGAGLYALALRRDLECERARRGAGQ